MPRRLPVLTMAALAIPALAATPLAQNAPSTTGAAAATASPALTSSPVPTSSSAARQEFVDGAEDVGYLFNGRAAQRFDRALALDSTYGLARVFRAAFSPQLDQAQRDSMAARGVADAAHGSPSEAKLAKALAELAGNRPAAAQLLFRELADMHPDNALVAMWSATVGRDSPHLLRAMAALGDGHGDQALAELAQVDTTTPIFQEVGAEARARLDHADEASAGRQRLPARRDAIHFNTPDLRNALALRRATKP